MEGNPSTQVVWVDCTKQGIPHLFGTPLETNDAIYTRCENCPVTIREGK